MPVFRTYTPQNVIVSYKHVNVTGFMDGTFIEAERNEDSFTLHKGATGDGTRTQNLNRSGTVKLTLVQTSPTNDLLAALAALDELTGLSYGALQIKDVSGTLKCRATQAWIKKLPKIERAKESGSVVWEFECDTLEIFAGGNVI